MENIVESLTSFIMENTSAYLNVSGNLETLEKNLSVLTSKASDINIRVKNAEISGKKRKTMEVQNWFEEVKRIEEKSKKEIDELKDACIPKRMRHARPVRNLKDEVCELINRTKTFGELVIDEIKPSRGRLFPKQLHLETLNQQLGTIMEWLEEDPDTVPVIGIHGMGGVGKTTLARHIYNHICTNLQDKSWESHVYWVTVSQEANVKKLQNDLAKKMNLVLPEDYDEEEKASIICQEMKNVVLIFDDVWKFFRLSKIGVPLGADGCKVIITSRSLNVCNEMGCKKIIKLEPLSEQESCELFLWKLDCGDKLSPEVEKGAKEMAKKCDGLPLAIITVARSMTGLYDIQEWRDALEELKLSITKNEHMEEDVLPRLRYSYDRLRDHRLQQCFLFCSLYPEDFEISRDELMSNFISEGIMHQRNSRAAEFDQGHALLNKLVNVCLLEPVGVEKVKMHDLLRQMAIEITRNHPRFMAKAGLKLDELPDERDWTEDLDKASFMDNNILKIPEGFSPRCPRLSTLILSVSCLHIVPDSFFTHMRGLRVLNLSWTSIEKLPSSISELENLNALLLRDCFELYYLPPLNKLKELRELDISCSAIQEVPKGIECLVKLQCLNMCKTEQLVEIPRGLLPQLHRLQQLLLPYHIEVDAKEVESLRLLEEFKGATNNLCNSKWFNKSPPVNYRIKVSDDAVDCDGKDDFFGRNFIYFHEYSLKEKGPEEELLLPQNIQSLKIKDCKDLKDCLSDTFSTLNICRDLKKCKISGCSGIKSILRIFSNPNHEEALKNLKELSLYKLPDFIGLAKWESKTRSLPSSAAFSSLAYLKIKHCHGIKQLFTKSLVQNLRNLESIRVSHCNQVEEIIADDDDKEGKDNSRNNNKCDPIALPKLRYIQLNQLPELRSIYKGTINCCDTIERIFISECSKLERLAFGDEKGDEGVCSDSSSSNDPKNVVAFPKLRSICLEGLKELKSIYKGTINCCDTIEEIQIHRCSKLERLPFFHEKSTPSSYYNNNGISTYVYPKLRRLILEELPELESICECNMVCDSID